MSREAHVRFCERLGVKFPRSTHPVAESFFSTLKNENVHRYTFITWRQAQDELFDYIEIFYNKKRAHSAIGFLTPEEKDRHAKMVA